MNSFQLLLFLHIVAAIVWTGGALVGTLIGIRLRKTGDTHVMAAFCRAFAEIAGPMFGGSGLLVLGTGIAMVAQGGGAEFADLWVSIGFALFFISFIVGAGPVGMRWTRIGKLLSEEGASIEQHESYIKRTVAITHVDVLLRIIAVLVMVVRPT